jgi:soluble lytic murein transglycosylase-like protein
MDKNNMVLIFIGLGLLGVILMTQNNTNSNENSLSTSMLLNLPDVLSDNQGGSFKRDYDDYFSRYSSKYHVPFALLKAHAIRESSLNPSAFLADSRGGSYGLMQLSWGPGNDRFKIYGWSADQIGDGQPLYNNAVNIAIGAQLIADNLKQFGNVKDAINAYNTGVAFSTREAPANYTQDVIKYYETLIGRKL